MTLQCLFSLATIEASFDPFLNVAIHAIPKVALVNAVVGFSSSKVCSERGIVGSVQNAFFQ